MAALSDVLRVHGQHLGVASIVAVVAGVVGFFVVLRGAAFVADAVPQGAFTGAAGASLIGVSTLVGLAVASLAGALGIGWLGRRGRHDVATALVLVVMLGLGSLFLSFSSEYAPEIYSLLFGEVLGVSATEISPVALLGGLCVVATAASCSGRCCSPRSCPNWPRRAACGPAGWNCSS